MNDRTRHRRPGGDSRPGLGFGMGPCGGSFRGPRKATSAAVLLALAGAVALVHPALAQEKPPPRPFEPQGKQLGPGAESALKPEKGQGPPRATPTRPNPAKSPPPAAQPNDTKPNGGGDSALLGGAGMADASDLVIEGDSVNLSAFSEPVQLSALVSMLADTLGINIAIKGDIPGTVVFNAPVTIPKAEFLSLVDALLEQQNYTITQGAAGFFNVVPIGEISPNLAGDRAATRVIATPNLRPTALQAAIQTQLGTVAGLTAGGITYVDELGVIIATGTQRKLDIIDSLVKQILAEYAKQEYLRIELNHVAAPVARQRVLELIGQGGGTRSTGGAAPGGAQGTAPVVTAGGGLDNMGDRLTVDPQGNALIFKGLAQEVDQIRRLMAIIDTGSSLRFKRYEVGSAAQQVADLARSRGLGEVTTIQSSEPASPGGARGVNINVQPQTTQSTTTFGGGPTMIVDDSRGQILYYATESQQTLMDSLIKELDIQAEEIVVRTYKVRHSKADEVAELILAVLNNESPSGGGSSLLPQQDRRERRGSDSFGARERERGGAGTSGGSTGNNRSGSSPAGGELTLDAENAFVVADAKNNQIMVKAALKQQRDFERLIEKLDLRRPSVYIEATIVSVTWDDTMRLAFETQLINAGGKGGLLQTNFGLSNVGDTTSITAPKTLNAGLPGLTTALLRTDYVPIAVNALQTEADAKVLSKPQLLVDDNEYAEIVSLQEQATASGSTIVDGTQTGSGFGGYVEAGTRLMVTPQIAGGGYLRLLYEVELSSFTGQGTVQGGTPLPPPRLTNTVTSDSVTVPSDFTVVVGGLTVDSKNRTVVKVPFLGDIPIVGLLFQDRNTGDRKTTLYVFLTPRVVRDPADIRLLSMQPKLDVGMEDEGLDLRPTLIESAMPNSLRE